MESSSQRELHDALWKSHGGFDLVLAPVMMALVGLWLDSVAGTTPVLMLVLLAAGVVGAVLKVYYDWKRRMADAVAERDRLLAEAAELRAGARGDHRASEVAR